MLGRAAWAGLGFVIAVTLSACGDGDDHDVIIIDHEPVIVWSGSVNEDLVVDATNDFFVFLLDGGYLVFGDTVYLNVWVTAFGELVWEDHVIGAVELVESEFGEPIAAMIGNDGDLLDFYGPEWDLHWRYTDLTPVFWADAAVPGQGGGASSGGNPQRLGEAMAEPNAAESEFSGSSRVKSSD